MITHQYHAFNGRLFKQPLKLVKEWLIESVQKCICLAIPALALVDFSQNEVNDAIN